jgi:murein DD-endopeptidase MepM/ murein hydrolase activator NlpD
MNRAYELYIRLRKQYKAWVKRFMTKGHERLTLMLIPHSEKRIFNVHISNFTISFLVITLALIVFFSILSLNDHETSQTTISELSSLSKVREGQIDAFRDRSTLTINNFTLLEQQFERLASSVGVGNVKTVFPFYGQGGLDYTVTPEMQRKYGKDFSLPEEIRELDNLNRNVARSTEQLKRVNSFIDNLKQVMEYTPSLWPVAGGGFITSSFGSRPSPFTGIPTMHTGVDIAWWPGSPVRCTASGTVTYAGFMGGYGLAVRISHKYGFSSLYGHMQNARVSVGDTVQKGQVIGSIGNTGLATGYHLHYEVILGDAQINPEPYLTSKF